MQQTSKFEIPQKDIDNFPESKRFCIGRSGLLAIKRFISQPGGAKFLDEKIKKMKREGNSLINPNLESNSTPIVMEV